MRTVFIMIVIIWKFLITLIHLFNIYQASALGQALLYSCSVTKLTNKNCQFFSMGRKNNVYL